MDKTRTCRICGKNKPISDFYIRENGKHRTECIACQKQRIKQWYNRTKDIRLEKREEYFNGHRTELLEKQKKYYAKNKKEILEKHYARRKAKKLEDVGREIETMRWTIQGIMHHGWAYTQQKNTKREKELEEIFGCSIEELKEHLYKTWEEEYGVQWGGELFHIDHIIPLLSAKSVEDVRRLCNYSNLRMLKPQNNLSRPKSKYRKSLSPGPSETSLV